MPPDRISASGQPLDRHWLKRSDRNIPQQAAVETRDLRDSEVNMQVGAFIAAPVLGIVLVLRPEVYELAAAAVCVLLAACRRSYLRYRRLRTGGHRSPGAHVHPDADQGEERDDGIRRISLFPYAAVFGSTFPGGMPLQ